MTHAAWHRPIAGKLFQIIFKAFSYGWVFQKSVYPKIKFSKKRAEKIEKLKFRANFWMSFPEFANKGWPLVGGIVQRK